MRGQEGRSRCACLINGADCATYAAKKHRVFADSVYINGRDRNKAPACVVQLLFIAYAILVPVVRHMHHHVVYKSESSWLSARQCVAQSSRVCMTYHCSSPNPNGSEAVIGRRLGMPEHIFVVVDETHHSFTL